MKRMIIAAVALVAAVATAQEATQPKTAADPQQLVVATINGETVTRAKLDSLYNAMPVPMRAQYEKAGGKMAFLDNYVAKRLLIQEAMKSGFDKKPQTQAALEAARDSALFDKYVHDTVAEPLVSDADARKYYDEHKDEFATPEMIKVRHIVISWNRRPKPEAFELIKKVALEIRAGAPSTRDKSPSVARILMSHFSEAARRYSEDGVASVGGELGWVSKGSLDPKFEEAAFSMPANTMSGIVESQFGYHLIFVEDKKPAGTQPFSEAKPDIREFLLAQKAADVMGSVKRLTNELRSHSKIALYPENVN